MTAAMVFPVILAVLATLLIVLSVWCESPLGVVQSAQSFGGAAAALIFVTRPLPPLTGCLYVLFIVYSLGWLYHRVRWGGAETAVSPRHLIPEHVRFRFKRR